MTREDQRMLGEIKFIRSIFRRTSTGEKSPTRGPRNEDPGSTPPRQDPEWQDRLEMKINQAREVIWENELNMRILYLKDLRSK